MNYRSPDSPLAGNLQLKCCLTFAIARDGWQTKRKNCSPFVPVKGRGGFTLFYRVIFYLAFERTNKGLKVVFSLSLSLSLSLSVDVNLAKGRYRNNHAVLALNVNQM